MAERRPPGFNIPLEFYDGPEVKSIPRRIRAAAIGVWALAGNYAATKLTDGYVDAETLNQLGCTPAIRAALMATVNVRGESSPLWEPAANGGIQFTNWRKWQRTNAEVKAYRESEAERKRNARDAKRNGSTSQDTETSGRTNNGHPTNVQPEDGDPKTKTETKTKTESLGGVTSGVGVQTVTTPTDPHTPPSQFCKQHPHGTPDNCGPCANARKAFEAWKQADDAAEQAAFDEAAERQRQVIEQRKACPDCDEHGWILDAGDAPVRRCTHPNLMAANHA